VGHPPPLPRPRRERAGDHPQPGRLRAPRAPARLGRPRHLQPHRRGHAARGRDDAGPVLRQLRRLHLPRVEARMDAGPARPRGHLPALRQLHEPLHEPARAEEVALLEHRAHGPVRLEEGRARGADLPAGARPHGRGIPRPVRLQVHDARLHAHLRAVPRGRGQLRPRAHLARREGRQQGRHLGHERARLVHHLLGRDQDRRGARDGQHGLQDP